MKKIKFSVLMSVYYKEKSDYLKISLDSIINQTLKPDEIVLVEDGPLTDELYEIINFYKSKYNNFKTVRLQKNMGLGNALNEGLKYCKYEYVARMDSDDCSLNNRFEKQIKILSNNPQIDLIGSNISEFDINFINKTSKKIVPETDSQIKKYIKKRNPFNHMTVIYKKNKVMEAGNYVDCPYFEDYYLWCRMAKNGCIFYNIQETLVNVRAGIYMIEKRGGRCYNKYILNFQNNIKKLGIINWFEFLRNVIIRIVISSLPKKIRMNFYKKKLRRSA